MKDIEYRYELRVAYSLLTDNNSCLWDLDDMVKQFDINKNDLDGCQFIYAEYSQGDYEGDVFVLFIKDGRLFEVNGSHCSCYGLEGLWEPEETTVAALLARNNVPHDVKEKLKNMVIEKVVQ